MSRQPSQEGNRQAASPSSQVWRGNRTLTRVQELNTYCLELLTRLAESESPTGVPSIVTAYRDLWQGLDAAARKRAAQIPVLLVEAHFRDADWWRWAASPRSTERQCSTPISGFPVSSAQALMRQVLTLARDAACVDPRLASLLLGLSPIVIPQVATLGLEDIEHLTLFHSEHLHLRWLDNPTFWRNLLLAARTGDAESLYDARLYALQLLGEALIPSP